MQAIKLLPVILIALLLVGGFLLVVNTSAAPGATIVVDTLEDNTTIDGYCSLREAITAANTNAIEDTCPAGDPTASDTITFGINGTIILTGYELPYITKSGGRLIIDGADKITIDGNHDSRIITVDDAAELTLLKLQLINGLGSLRGGGLINHGYLTVSNVTLSGNIISPTLNTALGGAIYNNGKLNITDSIITNNTASGKESGWGGAIFNTLRITAEVYITNSSIFSNSVSGINQGRGGGLLNANKIEINNSTIYSNSISSQSAEAYGSGIYNNKTLTMTNSTISHNTGGDGVYNALDGFVDISYSTFAGNDGWGIYNGKFMTITASIIDDGCTGSPITDGGDNLEYGVTCGFTSGSNTDPLLAPLGDYGGETFTHALLPGSPAIDAVNTVSCTDTDQRGVSRPVDGDEDGSALCDIGAYEFRPQLDLFPAEITITNDEPDPSYVNQPFTVTTVVSSTIGIPTGTVTVTVGESDMSCGGNLIAGTSSCQLLIPGPGTYTLEAVYAGQSPYTSSVASAQHVVVKAPTTTTVLSDLPDPSMVGETVKVDFEVSASFGIPGGKVSVYVIATSDTCSSKLVNGSGSCILSISKPGSQTLTVSYNGNAAYLPSSANEEHTVESSEPPPEPEQDIYLPLVIGG